MEGYIRYLKGMKIFLLALLMCATLSDALFFGHGSGKTSASVEVNSKPEPVPVVDQAEPSKVIHAMLKYAN